jgi:hypothetical protein
MMREISAELAPREDDVEFVVTHDAIAFCDFCAGPIFAGDKHEISEARPSLTVDRYGDEFTVMLPAMAWHYPTCKFPIDTESE